MLRRGLPLFLVSSALVAALLPATVSAETHTFVNTTPLGPIENAGTFGPANEYPSSIAVSGVPGTVTKATVTVLGLGSANADDADIAIRGPNGATVMLMSDACGNLSLIERNWTFDDDAAVFLPNSGSCGGGSMQVASFLPSNYEDPDLDDLSPNGGPARPYLNSLAVFNGVPANGGWDLFLRDDNDSAGVGFSISGWVLKLEVQPPAPTPASPSPKSGARKKCKKKSKKAPASAKKCKGKKKGK